MRMIRKTPEKTFKKNVNFSAARHIEDIYDSPTRLAYTSQHNVLFFVFTSIG